VISVKLITDRGPQNYAQGGGSPIISVVPRSDYRWPTAAFSRVSLQAAPSSSVSGVTWFRCLRARPLKVSFVVERFACLTLGLEQFRAGLRGLENQFGLILAAGLRTAGQCLAQFLGNFVIAFRLG
jgi:hypothetical protein